MRFSRLHILVLLITLLAYTPSVGQEELEAQRFLERVQSWEARLHGLEYVADEIIVEFQDARSLSSLDAATLDGFQLKETFQYRPAVVFGLSSGESVAEGLARLDGAPGIARVSPNLIRHCSIVPNDPYYNHQQYHIPINSQVAWDRTTGSSSVTVAVVDTGLDVDHPEFADRIVWTQNFHDPSVQGNQNVFDDSGHGTAVAGIIAARGNNSVGIAGMAWDIRIMAFRACGGESLGCTIANEVKGIDAAVARGADVINLSLGGKGTIPLEIDAVQDAYNAGVVLVAASGNATPGQLYQSSGNLNDDHNSLYYPAAFPEVIGVAALDNKDGQVTDPGVLERASFSNYGEDIVSVAAVGTLVQTTVPHVPIGDVPYAIYPAPNYAKLSGTSFACPQVAGAACLMLSLHPGLTPAGVRARIEQTAFRLGGPDADGNGVDDHLGYGVPDAAGALGGEEEGSTYENPDFRVGVGPSPLFVDDIFVIVYCKTQCDDPPEVTYFIQVNAENGSISMKPLPAHVNTWLGRFRTTSSGLITIQVFGSHGDSALETLTYVYDLAE